MNVIDDKLHWLSTRLKLNFQGVITAAYDAAYILGTRCDFLRNFSKEMFVLCL